MTERRIPLSLKDCTEFEELVNSKNWKKVSELIKKTNAYDDLRYRYSISFIKAKNIDGLKEIYQDGISTLNDEEIHKLNHAAAASDLEFIKFLHGKGHLIDNKDGLLMHTAIEFKNYAVADYLLSINDEIDFPLGFFLDSGELNEVIEYYEEYLKKKQEIIKSEELKVKSKNLFEKKKLAIKRLKKPKIKGFKN